MPAIFSLILRAENVVLSTALHNQNLEWCRKVKFSRDTSSLCCMNIATEASNADEMYQAELSPIVKIIRSTALYSKSLA